MVLHKLQHEITNSNNKQKDGNTIVICCLQEVSYDWAGELHTFFANHGYHMVTGLYGKWYSGYMGVALAWPTDQLEVLNVDISRLSETRPGGWPKKLSSSTSTQQQSVVGTIVSSVLSRVQSLWTGSIQTLTLLTQKVGLLKAAEVEEVEVPPDHWTLSASRNNVLLTATLKDKTTGNIFCCANYHMPCAYYCPMAMTIHADLCAAHVQRLATIVKKKSSETTTTNDDDENDNNDNQQQQQQQPKRKEFYPYVLAGDFNIKPNEPVYRLLTTGQMDAQTDATFYPTSTTTTTTTTNSSNTNAAAADGQQVVERVVEWTPSMQHAMKSAYAEHNKDNGNKKEPDFTNYARIKEQEPFIDTLDYIFYGPPPSSLESASASWKVTDVAALPDRKDAGGPFPNLDKNEPSDHLLIAATLEMQ